MATVKGTVPSAIGAARPSPRENPGTYITAEELALLLRLLSQVLQRGQGGAGNGFLLTPTYQSPTKTSRRIIYKPGLHSSTNWSEEASQRLFLKGRALACRRGHDFAPNYPWDVRHGLRDDSNKAEVGVLEVWAAGHTTCIFRIWSSLISDMIWDRYDMIYDMIEHCCHTLFKVWWIT